MDLRYTYGDNGRAIYAKGHVPFDEFLDAVKNDIHIDGPDDPLLSYEPSHCWMRICRDFQEEVMVLVEASPNSRGAFKCTWLQDD